MNSENECISEETDKDTKKEAWNEEKMKLNTLYGFSEIIGKAFYTQKIRLF